MDTPFDPAKNLIAELGLSDLPEEERLALMDQAAELVEKRVTIRLMESLPEPDVEEANRLADDPEALLAFLASKTGDIGTVVAEETERVKEELREAADENAPVAEEEDER